MYPITGDVKALFEAEKRKMLLITGTDPNGVSINITAGNVMAGGFSIDRYSCNGSKLEIGTAVAAELTLKLDNRQGQFDGIIFEGTELFVQIGIADWDADEPEIHMVPCGYFTPDEQPRNGGVISIKALDRMVLFDATPPSLLEWVDSNGNHVVDSNGNRIVFNADVAFPTTVMDLVRDIALRCGVPLKPNLPTFPNQNFVITEMPTLQEPVSYRTMLRWCAGIMGTNAYIDWQGRLSFAWYNGNTSGYTMNSANRFEGDIYEDDITITGVSYTDQAGNYTVYGTDQYTLDLSGNYFVADGVGTILANIWNAISGFVYRPFSAKVVAAPYLWPMDVVTYVDRGGISHSCVLTNVNFSLNGITALEGKGKTEIDNSRQSNGAFTDQQAVMVQRVATAVDDLDSDLDQQGVFNRLTNNGELQGLYMRDGQLYINASYVVAGIIADRLGRNKWNLDDGTFQMDDGTIDLRSSDGNAGFSVGKYGDLAIGKKPDDMSSFEDNQCGFQVDNGGNMKVMRINLYGATSDDAPFVRVGTILAAAGENGYAFSDKDGFQKIFLGPNGCNLFGFTNAKNGFGFTGGITVNPDSSNPKTGVGSATFTTANGKTVTVTDGIITNIS